jgi:hypothetical protein
MAFLSLKADYKEWLSRYPLRLQLTYDDFPVPVITLGFIFWEGHQAQIKEFHPYFQSLAVNMPVFPAFWRVLFHE